MKKPVLADKSLTPTPIVVYPFSTWCSLRGISEQTARRLIRTGKVRATKLSARRLGIRSDDDLEYLNNGRL